jgi:hypothetical protein
MPRRAGTLAELARTWAYRFRLGPPPAHRPELGPCWLWKGTVTGGGYGHVWNPEERRMVYSHVLTWELQTGRRKPDDKDLDHLCRVQPCGRFEHLELVTGRTNTLRGNSPQAIMHRTNTCKRGHALEGGNVIRRTNGRRSCRKCDIDRKRRLRARLRDRVG